jgi:signal transduction histidine kinase
VEDLGLEPALRQECDSFEQRSGIRTEFRAAKLPARIPRDVALCLYRVAQEGLRNVHKHSASLAVVVQLNGGPAGITLLIEDSGSGFDSAKAIRKGGLGLVSMEERVRLMKGKLTVTSKPGKGTQVTASIPVETT